MLAHVLVHILGNRVGISVLEYTAAVTQEVAFHHQGTLFKNQTKHQPLQ